MVHDDAEPLHAFYIFMFFFIFYSLFYTVHQSRSVPQCVLRFHLFSTVCAIVRYAAYTSLRFSIRSFRLFVQRKISVYATYVFLFGWFFIKYLTPFIFSLALRVGHGRWRGTVYIYCNKNVKNVTCLCMVFM